MLSVFDSLRPEQTFACSFLLWESVWDRSQLLVPSQVRGHLEGLVTNLQTSKMTLEEQLNKEVAVVFESKTFSLQQNQVMKQQEREMSLIPGPEAKRDVSHGPGLSGAVGRGAKEPF